MRKRYSLRKFILFSLIVFTVVISIIVASLSTYNLYKSEINFITHNQQQALIHVQYEVEDFLKKVRKNANYTIKRYSDNEFLKENLVELSENITSILILDKNGILTDFYSESNKNLYKGFDYSNKKYYQEIKNGKEFYWTDIFLSTIDETQSLVYSFKFKDKIGVFFIKPTILSSFIKRFLNSDNTHTIRFYDNDGILILNPDKSYLESQRVNYLSQGVFTDLINKEKSFKLGKFKLKNSEEFDLGMYIKIEETGWYIVARDNYHRLMEKLVTVVSQIAIFLFIFILLFVIIIVKVLKILFSSLNDLEEATQNIASGQYNSKIKLSYFEEFNNFIISLKNMQHEIKVREDSLQKSVDSFEALLNTTMEAIILHIDGVSFDVNDISVKLLGYDSKEEMKNKNIIDFISDDSKQFFKNECIFDTEPNEIKLKKRDGTVFDALIQEKSIELYELNVKIITIIDITELKDKDKLLSQQSKLAAMGEMIGNIAHQWRQPLSTISTAATGMKIQKEFGQLDDNDFIKAVDAITNSSNYLSKTIDDFRNFFKSDKIRGEFGINDVINNSLSLVESSLKNNFVNLKLEIEDDAFVYGFENELMQVFVNIINNANDAFYNSDVDFENKMIIVNLCKSKTHAILKITDNAGGIPLDVLPKIFEPYFTTKHKAQGTGIGLYMSHQIIFNNFKGILRADNKEFVYENIRYKGAQFTIILDLYNN